MVASHISWSIAALCFADVGSDHHLFSSNIQMFSFAGVGCAGSCCWPGCSGTLLQKVSRIHKTPLKHKNIQDSPETQEHLRPSRDGPTITILTITWDSIAKSSKWPLCWWRLKSVLVWNKVAGQECSCSFHKESTPWLEWVFSLLAKSIEHGSIFFWM